MLSLWNYVSSVTSGAANAIWNLPHLVAGGADYTEKVIIREIQPASGNEFVRLAGLSGALAVGIGAYGAHVLRDVTIDPERKYVFDTAYRLHLIHSVALIGIPLTRNPHTVGTLFITGMLLFCGTCYLHAFTGQTRYRWITPIGGTTLIVAWLSMAL